MQTLETYDRENIGNPNAADWHHPATVIFWLCHTYGGDGCVVTQQYPPKELAFRAPFVFATLATAPHRHP